MDDPVTQCIERFRCARGALFAERRNRGYTLYDANSGAPVARLRPAGTEASFEVLYWSLWKNRRPYAQGRMHGARLRLCRAGGGKTGARYRAAALSEARCGRRNRPCAVWFAGQSAAQPVFAPPYWDRRNRWASTGPFGRTVLPIDDALRFIAYEDIFWVMT
jgi:hypothetical protein